MTPGPVAQGQTGQWFQRVIIPNLTVTHIWGALTMAPVTGQTMTQDVIEPKLGGSPRKDTPNLRDARCVPARCPSGLQTAAVIVPSRGQEANHSGGEGPLGRVSHVSSFCGCEI